MLPGAGGVGRGRRARRCRRAAATRSACDGRNWYTRPTRYLRVRMRLRLTSRIAGSADRRSGQTGRMCSAGRRMPSRVSSSTAPSSVCDLAGGVDDDEGRLGGDAEALVDSAGVVAQLRERQTVAVDERLELVVGAGPGDADEVDLTRPPLRGRLDRGGFPVAGRSIRRPEPQREVAPGVVAEVDLAAADGRRGEVERRGATGRRRLTSMTRRRRASMPVHARRIAPTVPSGARPYPAPVRTRTLLLLAVGCGFADPRRRRRAAAAVAGQDEPPAAVGRRRAGPGRRHDGHRRRGAPRTATSSRSRRASAASTIPTAPTSFRLVVPGDARRPTPTAGSLRRRRRSQTQPCTLAFDLGDADGTSRVLLYRRGDERARWELSSEPDGRADAARGARPAGATVNRQHGAARRRAGDDRER